MCACVCFVCLCFPLFLVSISLLLSLLCWRYHGIWRRSRRLTARRQTVEPEIGRGESAAEPVESATPAARTRLGQCSVLQQHQSQDSTRTPTPSGVAAASASLLFAILRNFGLAYPSSDLSLFACLAFFVAAASSTTWPGAWRCSSPWRSTTRPPTEIRTLPTLSTTTTPRGE